MQTGVLAMFDALGFKGIWGRSENKSNPERVIRKLLDLERDTNAFLDADFGGSRAAQIENPSNVLGHCTVAFLSDTVVLGLATKPIKVLEERGIFEAHYAAWSLVVAARFASLVLRQGAATAPALAYRGCIAYGDFAIEKNFIVGPAVDSAAEHMDRAQGALVWLTPDAERFLKHFNLPIKARAEHGLIPYRVPLKGGDFYETHVVSPFEPRGTEEQRAKLTAAILATFQGSLEVEIKRQNTLAFLEHASATHALQETGK